MTVLFDAERLRLDRPTFAVLYAWVRDGRSGGADGTLDELHEHRVLQDGAPHPRLAAGLAAVAAPVCRLRVRDRRRYKGGWRLDEGDGWVGRESAAFLLDLPDGMREFVTVPVPLVPEVIARVVEFGPRPQSPGPALRVAEDLLDDVVSPDRARQAGAAARFADAVSVAPALRPATGDPHSVAGTMLAGLRRYWDAVVSWDPVEGAVGNRACRVLDTDSGMWRVEPAGDQATLRPTTPTALWRAVVQLLPHANELKPFGASGSA